MQYNVTVIGSGPGGYVAAIRCAQLGFKTAIVEKYNTLGGTCLNVGCIPSKALLESSHFYEMSQHELAEHGVEPGKVKLNLAQMLARKDKVVNELTSGIAQLFKANKVEWLQGRGRLLANKRVEITDSGKKKSVVQAQNVILATGSIPVEIGATPYTKDLIVDSTGALEFTVPVAEIPPDEYHEQVQDWNS